MLVVKSILLANALLTLNGRSSWPATWRIIPNSKWLVSPLSRAVPLLHGLNFLQMRVTNHLHPQGWSSKCYYKYTSQSTWLSWHLFVYMHPHEHQCCASCSRPSTVGASKHIGLTAPSFTSHAGLVKVSHGLQIFHEVTTGCTLCQVDLGCVCCFVHPKWPKKKLKTSQTQAWLEVHMWSQLDSNGLPEIVALSEVWGISWQLLDYQQAGNLLLTCKNVAKRRWSELQTLT